MSWGTTAIIVIFAAFVLLLILNPNMSCFGRRIKSPFYPLLRKKRQKIGAGEGGKKPPKTEDYGFH
jgi:hypothetical protein